MIAVLDTNIIVDALNGIVQADEQFVRHEQVLISRITCIEVMVGAAADVARTRGFLSSAFETVELDLPIAEKAIELQRSHRIRLPDAIIRATEISRNAIVVTRNTRDFKSEWDGVHIPYELVSDSYILSVE